MTASAERLFDGREMGRPGWTVDRYASAALIQHFGRHDADPDVLDDLVSELMTRGDVVCVVLKERGHIDKKRAQGRVIAGELPPPNSDDPLGARPGRVVIEEQGLRFGVDLLHGANTGIFLDARPIRAFVRRNVSGKRVLNLFSYTSAFGVAAMAGGASYATNVDIVPSALERGRVNYLLNGLPADPRSHSRSDVFEFLARSRKGAARWDLVISDPPPVPTVGRRRKGGGFDPALDTERLLRAALAIVAPGGALLAMSASLGTSRFEAPLERVLADTEDLDEPRWLERAKDFPGEQGLRAAWIRRLPGAARGALPAQDRG